MNDVMIHDMDDMGLGPHPDPHGQEPPLDAEGDDEHGPEDLKDYLDAYRDQAINFNEENLTLIANTMHIDNVHENMTNLDLISVYSMMWGFFTQPPGSDIHTRAHLIFPTVEDMAGRWKQLALKFTAVERQLASRGFLDKTTPSGRDLHRQLNQVAFCMRNFYDLSVCAKNLKYSNDDGYRQLLNQLNPLNTFRLPKDTEMTPHQKASEVILEWAANMRLRREGRLLFEPAYYKDQFTYSYRPLIKPNSDGEQMDMLAFINYFLSTGRYPDLRHNLTVSGGNVATVCKQLEDLEDPRLPVLTRNYDFFAFQNGVYCIADDEFYTYRRTGDGAPCIEDIPSHNLIACKYHDMHFPYQEIQHEQSTGNGIMGIDVGPFDKILSYQKFSEKEKMWIWGFCGRLLYPTGRFDSWGMWPYFLGVAGTGKSTLVRQIASLMDRNSVGILGNNAQREFGFEGLLGKRLVLALDLDKNFSGDQMTIQSMIVGEEVSINRKNKLVVEKQWTTPAAFCANLLPNWSDNNGAMSRRLFVIEFLEIVNVVDTTLMEECKKYLPRFLALIVKAYHMLRHEIQSRSPKEKDLCPQKFRDSEERAVMVLNPMLGFLKEECACEANAITDKTVFLSNYAIFCKKRGLQKSTSDMVVGPSLSKKGIQLITPVRRDHNGMEKPYYLGVRLINEPNE